MDISALLGVERGVTALIGGGGKTTLMCTLAEELRRRGTVVVTTSTQIQRPEQNPVLLSGGAAAVSAALAAHGAVCVAGETAEGKLTARRCPLRRWRSWRTSCWWRPTAPSACP